MLGTHEEDKNPQKQQREVDHLGKEFEVSIGELMTSTLPVVAHLASVQEAVIEMRDHQVGALLVKQDEQVVGIITETDVVRKANAEQLNLLEITVHQIMSSPLVSIAASESLDKALEVMRASHISHLAIMEGDTVQGLVSSRDIIVYFTLLGCLRHPDMFS